MVAPLFTPKELADHQAKLSEKSGDWTQDWKRGEALARAHDIETVARAQGRATEYLQALLIITGSRGSEWVDFFSAFSESDSEKSKSLSAQYNTPEARRALYTMLRALTEVPKSWGASAFFRFLRGTGKQQGKTYHGAGMFGTGSGWKVAELEAICFVLVGQAHASSAYSNVLVKIIMPDESPENREYLVGSLEKNTDFIERLCGMLKEQVLADIAKPKEEKPKAKRVVVQFEQGDVINRKDLRDLPLPALVRIPIEKRANDQEEWVSGTVEHVIVSLHPGFYEFCEADAELNECSDSSYLNKDFLDGAVFLRVWNGVLRETKSGNDGCQSRNRYQSRKARPKSGIPT